MKDKQYDNLEQEQQRALDALTKLQTREYTIEQETNDVGESIEENTARITFEEIVREIERYIEEIKQDPEKMEEMIKQLINKSEEEEPTHWKYNNKIYCEKCFVKLMMHQKQDNLTVTGLQKEKGARCTVCGE